MPIEQRVVSGVRANAPAKPKIAPRERPAAPEPEPPAKEKKKILPVILGVIIGAAVVLGAVYWFVLRPGMIADTAEPVAEPGEVQTVESMNINLSDGHYLRLGFAVQLTTEAGEIEPARILDTAISLYSGQKFTDVLEPAVRESLKAQLADDLDELYEGEVMDVWLTDYVAQ